MPNEERNLLIHRILKQYWGYDDFRGIQEDIINSILDGRDTLGLMPTGGGKSVCFQVPALCQEGVCLVVTPLIALMRDQVEHLRKQNILAACIHSGMSREDILVTLDNTIFGGVKILYVSPERLASDIFIKKIKKADISFITVDEAHCISQWGYDFRPSYLRIADIKKELGSDVPVLALTATATHKVIDDIQERLQFREKNVFCMSFRRDNLAYVVRQCQDKREQMLHILNSLDGSAIIYTRSRARTKEISDYLNTEGVSSTYYHAGLDTVIKDGRQQQWQKDQYRVMVATNAFGMGIDKPDVRVVLHFDCPDSVEAYFQEAGRAGRDGKRSYAVLLYNDYDKAKLIKRIDDTFPDKDYIRKVYEHLAYFFQLGYGSEPVHALPFSIDDFCRTFHHFPVLVHSALKILQRAGYIEYNEENDAKARVKFLVTRHDLYKVNDVPKEATDLMVAMLRHYGSMFTDYVYVEESFLASITGMSVKEVYETFKLLARRSIISFIPRQNLPTIYYTRYREEPERIVISKEVYEERRTQFSTRIYAMIHYATNNHVCRSRQLLRYFGEATDGGADCHLCDVCLSAKGEDEHNVAGARTKIMELLKDGQVHTFEELHNIGVSDDELNSALESLISEEIIQLHSLGVTALQ